MRTVYNIARVVYNNGRGPWRPQARLLSARQPRLDSIKPSTPFSLNDINIKQMRTMSDTSSASTKKRRVKVVEDKPEVTMEEALSKDEVDDSIAR